MADCSQYSSARILVQELSSVAYLVPEMAYSGEDHRYSSPVGSLDDFFVTD